MNILYWFLVAVMGGCLAYYYGLLVLMFAKTGLDSAKWGWKSRLYIWNGLVSGLMVLGVIGVAAVFLFVAWFLWNLIPTPSFESQVTGLLTVIVILLICKK